MNALMWVTMTVGLAGSGDARFLQGIYEGRTTRTVSSGHTTKAFRDTEVHAVVAPAYDTLTFDDDECPVTLRMEIVMPHGIVFGATNQTCEIVDGTLHITRAMLRQIGPGMIVMTYTGTYRGGGQTLSYESVFVGQRK